MEFGWINIFGAIIVAVMLIPNMVYAVYNKDERNLCTNKGMNLIEQVGRYACIILMWLPLFVWKFGFPSVFEMLLYLVGNGLLLIAYLFVYVLYLKEKNARRAIILAVLPACIFILSGGVLRHWSLIGFSILFAVGHIYVTKKNIEAS